MRVIRKTIAVTNCECVRVSPDGKTEHLRVTLPGKLSFDRAASALRKMDAGIVLYAACNDRNTYVCPVDDFLKIAKLVER